MNSGFEPVSMTACAAGVKLPFQMNAEWRTAAECAMASGGEPITAPGSRSGPQDVVAALYMCRLVSFSD